MNKIILALVLLVLSGCTTLVIHDGEQDMLVADEKVKSGCYVKVDDKFKGVVSYQSSTCQISVSQ